MKNYPVTLGTISQATADSYNKYIQTASYNIGNNYKLVCAQ